MLVLTRKAKETLVIDNKIKITVVAIEGDRVKLAIDAPKNITILRKEIYDAIKEENKASSHLALNQEGLSQLKNLIP